MSDDNVVTLGAFWKPTKKVDEIPELIPMRSSLWEHPCGGTRFILRAGGPIECGNCGKILVGVSWSAP